MWTYFACSFFVPYMYVIKSIIKLGHQNIGLVANILTKMDKGKCEVTGKIVSPLRESNQPETGCI